MDALQARFDDTTLKTTPEIPTELLIVIVDHIDVDDDLLALATTSRRLHTLALRRYFFKHRIDPFSKELHLKYDDNSVRILPGLALSLDHVGAFVDRLSYDLVYTTHKLQMANEVRALTHFFAKLSSTNSVVLHFMKFVAGALEDWRDMIVVLLSTILARPCQDITIITSQPSSFFGENKRISLSSQKPSKWLKNYWPTNHRPPSNTPTLRSCTIMTYPPILRPFYFHILNVNSGTLCELSFHNIFGGGNDLTTMLAHLHFPRLRRLKIIYGVIPRDLFVKFLAKHPGTLTSFEYHHVRYEPRPKAPMPTGSMVPVFQTSLEELRTSPEHITKFLPAFDTLTRLRDVVVNIEELVSDFAPLVGALRALTSCKTHITLTLSITRAGLGFGAWFTHMFGRGFNSSSRPERKLHCVQTLVLHNGDWGFEDNAVLTYLPRWLGLFPELKALTIRDSKRSYRGCYLPGEEEPDPVSISAIKEACPDLFVLYAPMDSPG